MSDYLRGIDAALTGAPDTPLVFLCNFEVEGQWARGHVGLPGAPFSASGRVVRHMEQLGLLLAGPDDFLVSSEPVDAEYLEYVRDLGFAPPTVLLTEPADPALSTTERALASPRLLARLAEIGRAGGRLLPMGVSTAEEELARAAGLPLAVPDAGVFERVNSKIYSRHLVEHTGLRAVPGHCVTTVAELTEVVRDYRSSLEQRRIVVKEAYGVSGKGLVVLESPAQADGLLRLVARRANRSGDDRISVVVEEWLPKRFDLNYQFTVHASGATTFDFVKQATTDNGVHIGHVMPADLTPAQVAEIRHAAGVVGARLHADGFHGVAGVDAILGADDVVYPVLEINARLNMSTYQGGVLERRGGTDTVALARHYTLRLTAPCAFTDIRKALADSADVVVTCFGTVNANAGEPAPFEGRLYTMLFAQDRDRLATLDTATATALAGVPNCLEIR